MPTQKRSLNICFNRGMWVSGARMALGCARKLVRDGDFKGAEGPLRATSESLKQLEYFVYVYDQESVKIVRGLPEVIPKVVDLLRQKNTSKRDKVKAIDHLDVALEQLQKKVQDTCKGKLPGYASK